MPDAATPWEHDLLTRSAAAVEFPPTPDLVAAVRTRLADAPAPRRALSPLLLRAAVAASVVVIAALASIAISHNVRHAVADFLGLGVQGEVIQRLPTPAPGITPTPFPTPTNIESFATPVATVDLLTALGFTPALPPGAGEPLQAYVVSYQGVRVAVLHYESFDLWEENTGVFVKSLGFTGKGVPEQTILEELTINGRPAYWIRGGAHLVRYVGADGNEVAGSQRTVLADTLVWRGAAITYRLEGNLEREAALRLAQSLP